jgi:hypothetical protein
LRRRRVEVRERGSEEKARKREDWTGEEEERVDWWAVVGAGEGFPEKPEECHYSTSSKRRRSGDGAGDR